MNALKELSGDIHQGNLTLPSQKVEFERNEGKKGNTLKKKLKKGTSIFYRVPQFLCTAHQKVVALMGI